MAKRINRNNTKTIQDKSKYEELPTRKIISAYGGVGSLLETRSGSIIVDKFDEWDYFKEKKHLDPDFSIEDKRLLSRLKRWFVNLKDLVQVPTNTRNEGHFPSEKHHTISGSFFPKWMYCPNCKRFDHFDNWFKHWRNAVPNQKFDYNPPICFFCYKKDGKKKKFELEQVRFILISAYGNIADVPWDRWVFARFQQGKSQVENLNVQNEESLENEGKNPWLLDFDKEIPTDVYYEYTMSDKFNDLKGISIVAKDNQTGTIRGRQNLQGIFNLRVQEFGVLGNLSQKTMKVVIRSSNSVYYPNIVSSLFLPTAQPSTDITEEIITAIKGYKIANLSNEMIIQLLASVQKFTITSERLTKLIDNNFTEEDAEISSLLEQDYRFKEYQFIVSKATRYDDGDKNRLNFEPIPSKNIDIVGLNIWRMDRLKMTSVQTSYTRAEPIDKDFYLTEDSRNEQNSELIRKQYTSKYGKNTWYLPAIESYGEGVFIDFDKKKIDEWQNKNNIAIEIRTNAIQENYNKTKGIFRPNRKISPKLVMLHTFSHLIIKELEFLCGYPATSLQERLYISDDMQGILIYTIAGSEGSYGGLTSICKSDKIGKIIKSALHRATDCASDPICYHTELSQGQGVGGTNLAACYSCALLPETSCEEFNSFLDRALIIDNKFGYFGKSM
ncbi:MAG: hypothetical protein RLZZ292_2488 [Bacteroidota bacterium]|jgi:hypothetical protein